MSNTSDQTTKPSKKTRLIVGEVGVDTETGIVGKGHSYDNGKTFTVDDTIYGRIYHADDHGKIWKGIQDQVAKVVAPAKSAADSAVNAADAAVASAQVTSDAVSAIASATAEAKQGANEAMSRAESAWDVATGAKEAVTDFDPLLKSAQSDASKALTQIADTANTLSDAKTEFGSDVAVAKELASTAQTTAEDASGQAVSAVTTADGAMTAATNAKSDVTVAIQTASGASLTATNAQGDATIAKQTASEATVQASNAESDFAQLSIRANKIEANVATNSGAIASVQQTANGLTTTVAKLNDRDGINLFSQSTATAGYVDGRTGNVDNATSANEIVSDYIPVSASSAYTFQMWGTTPSGNASWYGIGEYDSNKNFILRDTLFGSTQSTNTMEHISKTITTTSTTAYVRVSFNKYNDYKAKFEKGSIATPWTPAPTEASVAYNSLKVTVDQTSDIINDPKTGLNATYQTAAGNATTISNVKGDVTQLQATATGLTSRVGDLESKTNTQQTAIEQNKAAIALKADQTTVDTLKGTVNQNTATLKTQADQIQSKVSASDVSGMLTGYATQTYAQSLVTQKADQWNLNLTSLQTDVNAIKTTSVGTNLFSQSTATAGYVDGRTGNVDNATSANEIVSDYIPVSASSAYTFQMWGTTPSGNASWYGIGEYDSNKNFILRDTLFGSTQSTNTMEHISKTITTTSTTAYVRVSFNKYNDYKAKFEQGSVATDWSPAPSEMATVTAVTNLAATVNGIQSQVYNSDGSSRITQLSGLIQSKVGTDDFNNLKQAVNLQTLDSADINNMKTNGHYLVHNLANNPIGGWVYVDVTGDGSTRIRQDVYQDNGTKHQYRRWVDTNWTGWEEGATYTEINQLQDKINLRVTKGDLISQINLQTGASLIQSDKLVLDANTTVLTGEAWIPSAVIESLDASKLTFYGANNTYATIGASVAQYDDDQQKSTINLQYNGGIEIHSSNQQGSILTMHDNTIRLASKSWGDNSNPYQYSGFFAKPNYSLMNTYHKDGTTSGVVIDDNQIHIYGNSKDQQLGALKADVGWYSINGKTGSLTGDQISLSAGNTQTVLTDNNININNVSDTNDKNYDVAIHIKGWAEMTGWFTCLGITQTSLLSTKTRIEPLDTKVALDKIVSANVGTYQFKTDVANGKTKRHASVIIDDVNDVAEYYTPEEFISENRMGRDDGDIIGYLMGAVQELKKQLDELKEKI